MQWPWVPPVAPPPRVIERGEPPGQLEAPYARDVGEAHACITWSGLVDPSTVAEEEEADDAQDDAQLAPISAESKVVGGYEVEVAEVNALFGQREWRSVHRAKVGAAALETRLAPIPRGTCALVMRGAPPADRTSDHCVPCGSTRSLPRVVRWLAWSRQCARSTGLVVGNGAARLT
jgi:hypothetical protein